MDRLLQKLLALVFFTFVSCFGTVNVFAQVKEEDHLSCRVTSQVLLGSKTGTPVEYGFFQNSLQEGDQVVFTYNIQAFGVEDYFSFSLYPINSKDDHLITFSLPNSSINVIGDKLVHGGLPLMSFLLSGRGTKLYAITSERYILQLHKYQANSWDGTLTSVYLDEDKITQFISFDCATLGSAPFGLEFISDKLGKE
nr:hypothetical protein 16 [Alphaproteobacteria bacterium]